MTPEHVELHIGLEKVHNMIEGSSQNHGKHKKII